MTGADFAMMPVRMAGSLIELWLLPMRLTQNMLLAGGAALDAAQAAARRASDAEARAQEVLPDHIVAQAEDQLGALDERAGDTAVNPAALVS